MPWILLCCSTCQAHRGVPLAGVLLCSSVHQALMGQPLYCSAANAGVWGERSYVMAAPSTEDSAVSPCFHGHLAFLHRHFPPQSPPSHPLYLFLHNQQQPSPWDCSTIPKLQLPASAPSRRPAFLPGGMYGCGKDCLILIPFRLPQISYHLLSALKVSPDSDNCPDVGIGSLLQFPHPPRAGLVLLTLLFSPLVLLSYQVLHGSIYSFTLVKCSYLLSAGVLHALLCLKVYS